MKVSSKLKGCANQWCWINKFQGVLKVFINFFLIKFNFCAQSFKKLLLFKTTTLIFALLETFLQVLNIFRFMNDF